jgi:hypothetical protein
MSPWLLAVPIGAAVIYFVWPKGAAAAPAGPSPYTPPPGPAAVSPGSARALSYHQRLDGALLAYRAVKLVGGTAAANALAELRGTLDVVKGMAEADLLARRIAQADMDAINAKIAAVRKEIGG